MSTAITIALVWGILPLLPCNTHDFYPELLPPPAFLPSNPFPTNADRMNDVSKSQV